jgi:hypothetical protein
MHDHVPPHADELVGHAAGLEAQRRLPVSRLAGAPRLRRGQQEDPHQGFHGV